MDSRVRGNDTLMAFAAFSLWMGHFAKSSLGYSKI